MIVGARAADEGVAAMAMWRLKIRIFDRQVIARARAADEGLAASGDVAV